VSLYNNASQSFPGSHDQVTPDSNEFVDRRTTATSDQQQAERRQFGSSHTGLSTAGRELAVAIDEYKVQHHRRYLTCDEMLSVMSTLGYRKTES
jgi:hypothetical protein